MLEAMHFALPKSLLRANIAVGYADPAALPDARLVVLDDLGHLPMEEDPARSLPPVRAFLCEGRCASVPAP